MMTKKVLPKTKKYIIGIDEVGRGPLAGPVTTAAIILPWNFQFSISNFQKKSGIKLRDSKKLSPKQRELWFKFIKRQKIPYAVAHVSPKIIDRINISNAANLAATRALKKVISHWPIATSCKILLDGGLKVLPEFSKSLMASGYTLNTIVRGDEKIPAIMLASIIAKIRRDKLMKRNHKKYPHYKFDKHKGYGTKLHYTQINKNGVSKIHRKSFLFSFPPKADPPLAEKKRAANESRPREVRGIHLRSQGGGTRRSEITHAHAYFLGGTSLWEASHSSGGNVVVPPYRMRRRNSREKPEVLIIN